MAYFLREDKFVDLGCPNGVLACAMVEINSDGYGCLRVGLVSLFLACCFLLFVVYCPVLSDVYCLLRLLFEGEIHGMILHAVSWAKYRL